MSTHSICFYGEMWKIIPKLLLIKALQALHDTLSLCLFLLLHMFWHKKYSNSIEKQQKIICNCPYLHFVNINAFTKFYQNPSIGPQDIEHNRNFNINQK